MKKPRTLLLAILAAVLLAAGGLYYVLHSGDAVDQQTGQESSVATREEALRQAREYVPPADQMCTTVITPARHSESGATYEFPTGCLPAGWERISQDEYERDQSASGGDSSQSSGTAAPSNDDASSGAGSSSQSNGTNNQPSSDTGARDMTPEERALEEARKFQPDYPCTTVITSARHIATGVTYDFPTGCIPDGWESIRNSGGSVQGSR